MLNNCDVANYERLDTESGQRNRTDDLEPYLNQENFDLQRNINEVSALRVQNKLIAAAAAFVCHEVVIEMVRR